MKKTARKLIVQSLLNEGELSAQEIYHKIKSEGHSLSYHTIYKAIRVLIDKDVLRKSDKVYSLCESWMNKKVDFLKQLKNHLKNTTGEALDDHTSFCFHDITELHDFVCTIEDAHLQKFKKEKKGAVIWIVKHCYNYLLQPAKELSYVKKLKENDISFSILCNGDTILDKWTLNAMKKYGARTIIGAPAGGLIGVHVYDDMIVEFYYGQSFLTILHEIYQQTPTINDLDITDLFDKLNKIDYTIHAVIHKDRQLVLCLQERVESFFK